MANIKVLRFMNGEELIGNLQRLDPVENIAEMENIAIVQVVPTSESKMTIGLLPFAPYADEKAHLFDARHITTIFTPNQDLINNYNRIFGGIVVPDKKIVV